MSLHGICVWKQWNSLLIKYLTGSCQHKVSFMVFKKRNPLKWQALASLYPEYKRRNIWGIVHWITETNSWAFGGGERPVKICFQPTTIMCYTFWAWFAQIAPQNWNICTIQWVQCKENSVIVLSNWLANKISLISIFPTANCGYFKVAPNWSLESKYRYNLIDT